MAIGNGTGITLLEPTVEQLLDVSAPNPQNGDTLVYQSSTKQWVNTAAAGGGTVTNVSAGVGLTATPNPITGSGQINLANTAVSAGSYTAANITVDAQGRIISAANGAGGSGITALTGDVSATGTGSVTATINPATVTPAKNTATVNTYTAGVTVDGGGSAITTGSKGFAQINYNCLIAQWTLLADVSGIASFDVKRSTYAGFPTTTSIIGASGNPPILAGDRKQTAAPSSWTSTQVSAGDVLEFVVSAASTVTRLNLTLQLTKN